MKVLLVEDEMVAARGLRKMLKEIDSNIVILDHLISVQDTVEWLSNHEEPDLIFLDIQLKDGLSFEIFERVSCMSPIIFCTAYDHYALKAFKLNSIDYLLKPYDKKDLEAAVEKLRKVRAKDYAIDYERLIATIRDVDQHKERFLVKAGRNFYHIPANQIACFITKEKVNFIKTFQGKQYVIDEYLDELERVLNPTLFFRVNRQSIVAIQAVSSVENDYGRYYVKLVGIETEPLAVSRSRVSDFKKWLGQSNESD